MPTVFNLKFKLNINDQKHAVQVQFTFCTLGLRSEGHCEMLPCFSHCSESLAEVLFENMAM